MFSSARVCFLSDWFSFWWVIRRKRKGRFHLELRIYYTMQRESKNRSLILTLELLSNTFLSIWSYLESSKYSKTFLVIIYFHFGWDLECFYNILTPLSLYNLCCPVDLFISISISSDTHPYIFASFRFKVWGNFGCWGLAWWCSCIFSFWFKFSWTLRLFLPRYICKVGFT